MNIPAWVKSASLWLLVALLLCGCSVPSSSSQIRPTSTSEPEKPTTTASPVPTETQVSKIFLALTQAALLPSSTPDNSIDLWKDSTRNTISKWIDWTNRVELADINQDGMVDIIFANGGDYDTPGAISQFSQIWFTQGSGKPFIRGTQEIFGSNPVSARVIKVHDLNTDGFPDIFIGTTWQSQSQLLMGSGSGSFSNETANRLPQMSASVGDLEFGDVDNDGDLDVVLVDWGPGNPVVNEGGRTMLWINDGQGGYRDVTKTQMPMTLVKFSWDLELIDIDNDYDLDILVSSKQSAGSFLFENDGRGFFTDVTQGRLPQFTNNLGFEGMDLNGDGYLDLVTIDDGVNYGEHIFLNDKKGGFWDATGMLWPVNYNLDYHDGGSVFLDFDSDGDADLLIGSLTGAGRLLENNGKGNLTLREKIADHYYGTSSIAVADLNNDFKLDIIMGQCEYYSDDGDSVYLGEGISPDTAPPIITNIEKIQKSDTDQPVQIHARIHDNKSPSMPQDWQSVVLRWTMGGETKEIPMRWYGEYLWVGTIDGSYSEDLTYQVCATDAAGNSACSEP